MATFVSRLKTASTWHLFTGLCIRRPAVVVPELSLLEKEISELLTARDFERSYLSLHEINQKMEDERLTKAVKENVTTNDSDSLLTIHEKELIWESEAEKFKPTPITPSNDVSTNLRSAQRMLDRPLILLLQKSNNDWTLPTISLSDDQTLRDMALTLSSKILPDVAKCSVFGNAPSAVYIRSNEAEKSGSQIYFFNAYVNRLWNGESLNLGDFKDFAWVNKKEMQSMISDKRFLKVLNSFVFEY